MIEWAEWMDKENFQRHLNGDWADGYTPIWFTTPELLEHFLKTRIPTSLPDPNDLKDIRLGQQ